MIRFNQRFIIRSWQKYRLSQARAGPVTSVIISVLFISMVILSLLPARPYCSCILCFICLIALYFVWLRCQSNFVKLSIVTVIATVCIVSYLLSNRIKKIRMPCVQIRGLHAGGFHWHRGFVSHAMPGNGRPLSTLGSGYAVFPSLVLPHLLPT